MPLSRPVRRALIAMGVTVFAVPTLGALGLQLERQRAEAKLVSSYPALQPLPADRPAHVSPPGPGSVGDAMERVLAEYHPALPAEWVQAAPRVCEAARGLEIDQLPAECAAVVDAHARWTRALLAASRAEDGRLPVGLERPTMLSDQPPSTGLAMVMFAFRVTSHDVRRSVGRGEADAGLSWCADALALARDLARRHSTGGVQIAVTAALLFAGPCGEALDAASEKAKREFAAALEIVARSLPDDGHVYRRAVVEWQLLAWGDQLSDEALSALPPAMRDAVQRHFPRATKWPQPHRVQAFVVHSAALRSALEAIDGPDAGREAAFARAQARLASSVNGLLSSRELQLDELYSRVQRLRLVLALLANAAHLDAGDTDAAAPGLLLRADGDARVLAPATAALARFSVRLHRDAAAQ